MYVRMLIAMMFAFACVLAVGAEQAIPRPGEVNGEGRRLVWHDEFNGDKLDAARWKRCYPGKADWCRYMSIRPDLVQVRDGVLVMTGVANSETNKDARPYLTGGIQSAGDA